MQLQISREIFKKVKESQIVALSVLHFPQVVIHELLESEGDFMTNKGLQLTR